MSYDRTRNNYNEKALNRIESILDRLEVEFTLNDSYIKFKCPIHGSNKISSGTIYLDTGLWQCHSDDCNSLHGTDLVSFIMGALDSKKEFDALLFIDKGHKVKVRQKVNTPAINFLNKEDHPEVTTPSRYYLDRGISRESLIEYNVGDCKVGGWAEKSIMPIYYKNKQYMGFTARSHNKQCLKCEYYHNPYSVCIKPDDPFSIMQKRWVHKRGTQISKTFYGIDKITEHKVVLVEGISCVWRLWDHKIQAIGCCGTSFGKTRVDLLKSMGITKIIIAADSDDAGQKFKNDIIKKYYKDFSMHQVNLPQKDVTDMSDIQIEQTFNTLWNKL